MPSIEESALLFSEKEIPLTFANTKAFIATALPELIGAGIGITQASLIFRANGFTFGNAAFRNLYNLVKVGQSPQTSLRYLPDNKSITSDMLSQNRYSISANYRIQFGIDFYNEELNTFDHRDFYFDIGALGNKSDITERMLEYFYDKYPELQGNVLSAYMVRGYRNKGVQ